MIQDLRGETRCDADAGRREAYECACGAVTVTVARSESSR